MITGDNAWLMARLKQRAKDAHQAEDSAICMNPSGYPCATRLASIHRKAAQVYEDAIAELRDEMRGAK